jgi:hypothetical protein
LRQDVVRAPKGPAEQPADPAEPEVAESDVSAVTPEEPAG